MRGSPCQPTPSRSIFTAHVCGSTRTRSPVLPHRWYYCALTAHICGSTRTTAHSPGTNVTNSGKMLEVVRVFWSTGGALVLLEVVKTDHPHRQAIKGDLETSDEAIPELHAVNEV